MPLSGCGLVQDISNTVCMTSFMSLNLYVKISAFTKDLPDDVITTSLSLVKILVCFIVLSVELLFLTVSSSLFHIVPVL